MDERLKIQPGQQELTPEQEIEAERFATEWIETQLSTEPVNEAEVEAWLRQTYQVAGLAPPSQICWLDGPLPFVQQLLPPTVRVSQWDSQWERLEDSGGASV